MVKDLLKPHSRKALPVVKKLAGKIAFKFTIFSLPDTGQTRCFDATGQRISCLDSTLPGQDGLAATGCEGLRRFVDNGDGTVTVTFEGTLQSAPTVNGPWSDLGGASPLTIPADQAAQFGRARN